MESQNRLSLSDKLSKWLSTFKGSPRDTKNATAYDLMAFGLIKDIEDELKSLRGQYASFLEMDERDLGPRKKLERIAEMEKIISRMEELENRKATYEKTFKETDKLAAAVNKIEASLNYQTELLNKYQENYQENLNFNF